MKKMFTEEQIKNLAEESGGGIDPASILAGIIIRNGILGLNEDGEVVKGDLKDKYVTVYTASEFSALSGQEKAGLISAGVFINGIWAGMNNALILPLGTYSNTIYALAIYSSDTISTKFAVRRFNASYPNAFDEDFVALEFSSYGMSIRGKSYPAYPANQELKTYHFLLANGNLIWRESGGLYLHTVTFDVLDAGNTMTFRFISDSSNQMILDQESNNFVIEQAKFIQPVNHGNFIFTPFGENGFNPDLWVLDTSDGAFSQDISLESIESDAVTPIS